MQKLVCEYKTLFYFTSTLNFADLFLLILLLLCINNQNNTSISNYYAAVLTINK